MGIVFFLGLILLAGFGAGKLINILKLPAVTGYLIIGLLLGPSVTSLDSPEIITELIPVNTIALSIIAFLIGGEFSIKQLKKCGKSVVLIAILQVLGAFTFVTLTLYFLAGVELYAALIFGAISTATALAATIMVLREYKAKGVFTNLLLAVIAIDDALCLIIFGLVTAVAKAISGKVVGGVAAMITAPIWELLGSFLLGGAFALALLTVSRRFREEQDKLIVVLGMVFVLAGVADFMHLSTLLSCMTMGCVAVNLVPRETGRVFKLVNSIDTFIYVLFFVAAGANLRLGILAQVGLVGVGYIFSRVLGKMLGAMFGAKMAQAPPAVVKYLGLGLLPQAGVAIGLTLLVQQDFPEISSFVTTVVLGSVVVYEMVGPFFSKLAITKAGEVGRGE